LVGGQTPPPVSDTLVTMGETQTGWLHDAAKAVVAPAFGRLWPTKVSGVEHIPSTGPAILAPNHTSVLDSFILPAVLERQIMFVGKAEYLDDWKTRYLFPALGMIPIDRSGGSAAQAALDAAAGVLRGGGLFGIYPEGTRSRTGVLYKGRTGAARLSVETGAPIVPVGITGTREIQPPDARMPSCFKPATVSFGAPISADAYAERGDHRMMLREMTDDLMFSIQQMSGQRYEHRYAPSAAELASAASGDVVDTAPVAPPVSSQDVLRSRVDVELVLPGVAAG